MLIELEKEFIGTGEVKDFVFRQVHKTPIHYIYEVNFGETIHYEVIERRNSPVCIDFNKKMFSEEDRKEIYPRSNTFGKNAWTAKSFDDAIEKISKLKGDEENIGSSG